MATSISGGGEGTSSVIAHFQKIFCAACISLHLLREEIRASRGPLGNITRFGNKTFLQTIQIAVSQTLLSRGPTD
jgi:hypothetical protein